MNPLIQLKTTPPLLVTLALLYFGFCQKRQQYPAAGRRLSGGNTAEGQAALLSLTHWGV